MPAGIAPQPKTEQQEGESMSPSSGSVRGRVPDGVASGRVPETLRRAAALVLVVAMSGCSWWPWWSKPAPAPEPPAVAVRNVEPPPPVEAPKAAPPEPEPAPAPEPAPTPAPAPAPLKTTHDQVTILPKKDGSIGGVVVHQDDFTLLLDKPYATAIVEGPGLVTESVYDAGEAAQNFAGVLAALPAEPAKFLLYFQEAKDELTPDSEEEVEKIIADLANRPAPEISVIGHTDSVGTTQYNDKLSLQRAERVRTVFVERGIPEASITAAGRGKRELLVPTADGVAEPQNRRVEINVR